MNKYDLKKSLDRKRNSDESITEGDRFSSLYCLNQMGLKQMGKKNLPEFHINLF
jgi:hypothetical protein